MTATPDMDEDHTSPTLPRSDVKNGVCLRCGSGVLNSEEHIRDDLPPCSDRSAAHDTQPRQPDREQRAGRSASPRLTLAQRHLFDAMRAGARLLPPHTLHGTGWEWALTDEQETAFTRVSARTVQSLIQRGVIIRHDVGYPTLAPAYRDAT